MKIRSLCKQLALAGSILAISFACQSKKSDAQSPMPPMEQDDDSCDQQSSSEVPEQAPAPAAAVQAPTESVAGQSSAQEESSPAEEVKAASPAPAVQEVKAEAPKLESVNAVSENSATAPVASPSAPEQK